MNNQFVPLLSHSHRPLLIIADSYTSPPFPDLVPQLYQLMDMYQDRVDMLTVYIEEAHVAEEW